MYFLTWILESGVCAAILWTAYYALLRKESCFAFNRFYLLSVIPFSCLIPLLRLPWLPPEEIHAFTVTAGEMTAEPLAVETAAVEPASGFSMAGLLLGIYLLGAGYFVFRFVKQWYTMHRAMAASRFSDAENYPAFTFFRKIYINKRHLSAGDYEKILLHEQAHARQLHSLDLVVAQLFLIIQWFNPIAWKLKTSITATHEYLADAQVLAQGVDVNIYQQLLFHQTTGGYPGYANGFNYSLTKKRLIMMTKNKTGKMLALKLCCLLPALALPVAMFGLTTAENKLPVEPAAASTLLYADTTIHLSQADASITIHADEFTVNADEGETVRMFEQDGDSLITINTGLAGDVKAVIRIDRDGEKVNITTGESADGTIEQVNVTTDESPSGAITIVTKDGKSHTYHTGDEDMAAQLATLNAADIHSITVIKDTVQSNNPKKSTITRIGKKENVSASGTMMVVTKDGESITLSYGDEDMATRLAALNAADIHSITVTKDTVQSNKPKKSPLKFTVLKDTTQGKVKTVKFTSPKKSTVKYTVLKDTTQGKTPKKSPLKFTVMAPDTTQGSGKKGKGTTTKTSTVKYTIAKADANIADANKRFAAEKERLTMEKEQLAAKKEQLATEKEQLAAKKEQLATEKEQLAAKKEQLKAENEKLKTVVAQIKLINKQDTTSISITDVYAAGTVEVNPEFPGGDSKLMEFIKDNLKYPKEVAEQGIQGRVTMQFIIKSDGSIADVKTLKGVHPLLDAEAKRIVKAMPKWTPGKQKGEAVAVRFILPIAFQTNISTEDVYAAGTVEVNPEFPGGNSKLMEFIKDNLKYPKEVAEQGIQGRVTMQFIIKSDGSIGDVKTLKGVHPLLDAEAARVIKAMPKWTPGKQKGETVAVQFILPIAFQGERSTVNDKR